jgi:hypothetical protein
MVKSRPLRELLAEAGAFSPRPVQPNGTSARILHHEFTMIHLFTLQAMSLSSVIFCACYCKLEGHLLV